MEKKLPVRRWGKKIGLQLVHPMTRTVTIKKTKETFEKRLYDVRITCWLDREAISRVDNYMTNKGSVAKSRSFVYDKYKNQHLTTWHSVEEILTVLEGPMTSGVGFKPTNYVNTIQTRKS